MENDNKYIYINVWRDLYLSSINIASPFSMGLNFYSCHLKKVRAFFSYNLLELKYAGSKFHFPFHGKTLAG